VAGAPAAMRLSILRTALPSLPRAKKSRALVRSGITLQVFRKLGGQASGAGLVCPWRPSGPLALKNSAISGAMC